MSLLKTLQDYLCEYDNMDMRPVSEVLTDQTGEYPSSYALAPSGNGKTSIDVLGNRSYQNSYVFYAKENSADEIDRQDNHDFLEDFSDWLEHRNDEQDFPTLPQNYEVEEIQVSNAMLFDLYEDGTALYQIQIQLIFRKRRI